MTSPNSTIALSQLAEVNPSVRLNGLTRLSPVSFIPMADVAEGGGWIGNQTRQLGDVRVGYTPFQEHDVLFAKITPCMENGKGAFLTGLVNGIGFGSTEFHVLRAKNGSDPKYLYHWLQATPTRQRAIAFMGGSAGQQRVQADFFDHYRVPELAPDAQSRIAMVLDTIDAAIERTGAVIGKLKQVRAGLLHDLLTCGLDDNGELRDPERHPEQFQDSPLGRLPKGWEIRPCERVCREIVVGIVVTPAKYYVPSGVPVLRSANIREDGLSLDDLVFISPTSNLLHRKSMIREHDVLTVRTGYPGTTCVVPNFLDGANCVDLIISRPGPDIMPEFLSLWVNSPFGKDQVLRVQGGLAQQHFNIGEMRQLLVAVPAEAEQNAILARLQSFDDTRAAERNSFRKLQTLKSGLMSDLLTGRVPVPESVTLGGPA